MRETKCWGRKYCVEVLIVARRKYAEKKQAADIFQVSEGVLEDRGHLSVTTPGQHCDY